MFTDRRVQPRGEPAVAAPPPAGASGAAETARPARFLFDLDLSATAAGPHGERPVPEVEHLAAVATAKAGAFQAGFDAGRNAAEAKAAERTAAAATRLAEGADDLLSGAAEALARIEREAVAIAVSAARRLARTLVAREPLAEIEALLAECLAPLRRTPHLSVRLAPEEAVTLGERIAALADQHGFAGRLAVVADPKLGPSDCSIGWAEGAIVRDLARAEADIEAAVIRHFPATAAPSPSSEESE